MGILNAPYKIHSVAIDEFEVNMKYKTMDGNVKLVATPIPKGKWRQMKEIVVGTSQ